MRRVYLIPAFLMLWGSWYAQLLVSRDTINVIENGYVLKMPWANGINFANVSNIDLNLDGKKDIVAFDRINTFGIGRFRCFINTGVMLAGQMTYSVNPELSYAFPMVTNWALCRDYNCDGKEDLFCSTPAGIKVYANASYTNVGAAATLSFNLVNPLIYSNFETIPGNPPYMANLYAASNCVPGIEDIDGDGDLDILTFSPGGSFIEFHKSLRVENNLHCDSLRFELSTNCWGKMQAGSCSITLTQTCMDQRPSPGHKAESDNNSLDNGSCLTCIDSDGDHDQDLIVGDILCNILLYAQNGGSSVTAVMNATTNVYPNYPLAGNTIPLLLNKFPCAYYVDVDGDNNKDLVATPNFPSTENTKSMWYYKNTSLTNTVNFQFVKKNLFQDEMIEVGQNSFPVLFDYNADGLKDLLIGTYGYYANSTLQTQLTLYENIGSAIQPSYSLVTRDYASVLSQSLNWAMPTVGDIDGDGDMDILIANQSGQIHWLKNLAGPGAVCSFTFLNSPFSLPVTPFTSAPPAASTPQLFDIDKDSLLDLMIGGKNGKIWYYKNTGTKTAPAFSFITNSFGNVNVQATSNVYPPDGYAAPFFYDEGGVTKLLVGSVSGQIFYYSVPSASVNCNLISSSANGINEGGQSSVFYEDINGDGKRDLFIGNGGGGLSFFSSKGPDVGIRELSEDKNNLVSLFPNPVAQTFNITVDKIEVEKGLMTVTNILGKEIYVKNFSSNFELTDVSDLQPGIYFVSIKVSNHLQTVSVVKKIIKE